MFTWFIYRMLTIRPERTRKQIAVSSALTAFLFAAGLTVYLYVDIPVTDSVLFVLLFMYALYLFEGEWYVKLAWTIIDCVMMVMSTALFTVLFISITGVTRDILTASTGIRIAFVIMANAFMFSVYYAISKVRWRQDRLSLPPLLLFLGLAISLLICQEMQYSMLPQEGVPQRSVSISIIFISVISGGILVLFAMLSSQAEKRAEMEIQANTAALTRKHYSEIKGMYQGMLQQQHDMKHQINALEEMIALSSLFSVRMIWYALLRLTPRVFSTSAAVMNCARMIRLLSANRYSASRICFENPSIIKIRILSAYIIRHRHSFVKGLLKSFMYLNYVSGYAIIRVR